MRYYIRKYDNILVGQQVKRARTVMMDDVGGCNERVSR